MLLKVRITFFPVVVPVCRTFVCAGRAGGGAGMSAPAALSGWLLAAAGTMSYARVAQQVEQLTGLRRSPETCRHWVLHVGDSIQAWRRKKCAAIFETPTSCAEDFLKDPELLFLEADGCYIYMRVPPEPDEVSPAEETPLKRSKKQRTSAKKEVYLGLYYEGKRAV